MRGIVENKFRNGHLAAGKVEGVAEKEIVNLGVEPARERRNNIANKVFAVVYSEFGYLSDRITAHFALALCTREETALRP